MTNSSIAYLIWLGASDSSQRGSMSVHQQQLSELLTYGLPVMPGFVVTTDLFDTYLHESKLETFIAKQLQAVDWQSGKSIAGASREITTKIKATPLPAAFTPMLEAAYRQLGERLAARNLVIGLRPELVGSDLPPVQLPHLLPVKNVAALRKAIPMCYASLFASENLSPASRDDLKAGKAKLSIMIQPLIAATASGYLEPGQPITIEAILGAIEPLRERLQSPDRYLIDSESLSIIGRDINRQQWLMTDLASPTKHKKIPALDQSVQKIDQTTILELTKWAVILHHQSDLITKVEWQLDGRDVLWLTAIEQAAADSYQLPDQLPAETSAPLPIATGKSLSFGRTTAPILWLDSRNDPVQPNMILGVESLDRLTPALLSEAAGVIADSGHGHHELIELAKDYGLPVIVVPHLRPQLPNGLLLTLDGKTGQIYKGSVAPHRTGKLAGARGGAPVTGTKVLVALKEVAELSLQPMADGIGLLSAYALLAEFGQHPRSAIKDGQSKLLVNQLTDQFCQLFALWGDSPIVYCSNDLLSTDYLMLTGGDRHESSEANPLLGYRGVARSLQEPDFFKIELEAIRRAHSEYGITQLQLMLPFIRTMSEFTAAYHLILGSGLRPGHDLKIWFLCQVPASLALVEMLTRQELIQGVCFDVDALTQLLLGVDHGNEKLEGAYDLRDGVVISSLVRAIQLVRGNGLPTTALGLGLTAHPEALEQLVRAGIGGVVVAPDAAPDVRSLIASIEQRLLLDHAVLELHKS